MWLGLQAILQSLRPETMDSAPRQPLPLAKALPAPANEDEWHLSAIEIDANRDVTPLPLTFDSVIRAMEDSGTIYSEGDGSFAVCGNDRCAAVNRQILWLGRDASLVTVQDNPDWFTDAEQRSTWKIEGNLFDGRENVDHITLTGFAPREQWQYLLSTLAGDDHENLVFQFQQLGIYCSASQILQLEFEQL